ncbi:hypothetical protein ACFQ6Q_00665 [Streptomyces sp. NPDC056437]|uniref:hypothetical protein n=1 Tax=Streptomyces sp. NPDC056437 TaxID=3345816 RepID=UPI00368A7905
MDPGSLAERRAAALQNLTRRKPPTPQRYPGETTPSGDLPDDPWAAARYLDERAAALDEPPTA